MGVSSANAVLNSHAAPAAFGGMSTIHRAVQDGSGRQVAIKCVHHDVEPERFDREIEVLAELEHPAIVRYLGHGRTDDGTPYLEMEWLEGETLAARLQRGPLSPEDTVAVARRVLGALATAHAAGIIHRDVKPSNIFLVDGRADQATLIDFGVARVLGGRARTLTRTGVALGTPAYMSPEQVRGSRAVDGRADLFAFGSVLHECLTGRPVFVGPDELAVMGAVLVAEPGPLPAVTPTSVVTLISSLLRKNPAARPSTADLVLAMLDGVTLEAAPRGSRAWFAEHEQVAATVAAHGDHDGLLAVLCEAGGPAADEPARHAQLRCIAAGAVSLYEMGLGDLATALTTRVSTLAGALRLPDETSEGLVASVRASGMAYRRELPGAISEATRATSLFAAAGEDELEGQQHAILAELLVDTGDLLRARAEADLALAGPPTSHARARLALGKIAFAGKSLADARLHLRRVPAQPARLHGRALIILARAALRAGHASSAEAEVRAALDALASFPDVAVAAHAVMAQVCIKLKRPSDALTAVRAALASPPAPDLHDLVQTATTEALASLRLTSAA